MAAGVLLDEVAAGVLLDKVAAGVLLDEVVVAGTDMGETALPAYPSNGIAYACIVEALTENAFVLERLDEPYKVI